MPRRALVVEPNVARLLAVQQSIRDLAFVNGCTDFATAKTRLLHDRPDLLVTNLRLGPFNGLHLVYLAGRSTRCVVYMEREDRWLLYEAQRVGAFVELPDRLSSAVISYVQAALPSRDRRDWTVGDRRHTPRGGRRAADLLVAT